ncbi:MAG: tRNA dihydrouridine synthase DusB [Candidatus Omnitrophica bacterium]|nr:tRNA dihydrouridine synthase DusB [Candidatus Omnitrophota bacterium]
MLKIGTLSLPDPLVLAPLAGISSLPFRILNRQFGCTLAFSEMICARSMVYASKRTKKMLRTAPGDRPWGIQLLSNDLDDLAKAIDLLGGYEFDILDFNAACPQKKVAARGKGAALLKDPKKLQSLLELMVKKSEVAVTAKIRIGWDDSRSAVDIALRAQDAGISALFVHGRTKEQGYRGGVDYLAIKKIKDALSIPVIASGDILSVKLAKKMFDETGCDGLLLARGVLGNPWLTGQIKEFLKSGEIINRPSIDDIVKIMIVHLDLSIDFYGERSGIIKFSKFFIWYTRGFAGAKPLRAKVAKTKSRQNMIDLIEEFSCKCINCNFLKIC